MVRSVLRRWSGMLPALFVVCGSALAQDQKDALAGAVGTMWETVVPGATVTITNRQTGAKATSTTDQDGVYHFATLAPGTYDLAVAAEGLRTSSRRGIEVSAAGVRRDVRLQAQQADVTESIKRLEAAIASKPDDYTAHFDLGRAYFANANMGKAAAQFVWAFEHSSDHAQALAALTQVELRTGEKARALQFAQSMLAAKPDSSLGKLLEAMCFMRIERYDDAREALNAILKNDPDDVDALVELGRLDILQRQFRDAEAPYRRAYTVDPSSVAGLEGMAEVHLQLKEPDKALAVVAAEVEKDPQRRDLRKLLAAVEVPCGQVDKAIAEYRSLVDAYQDAPLEQADVYARMADAYTKKVDFQDGLDSLKKATQLAPENATYMASLASLYDQAGKKPEAIAAYRAALKLQPESGLLMNNLAYALADSGVDLDEALRMAQQAQRQLPDLNEIQDTIGWIYLKKNLVESAARVFQDLAEKYSKNATYHYHYALALAQKGDKAGALKELNAALEDKPGKAQEAVIREMMRKLS